MKLDGVSSMSKSRTYKFCTERFFFFKSELKYGIVESAPS